LLRSIAQGYPRGRRAPAVRRPWRRPASAGRKNACARARHHEPERGVGKTTTAVNLAASLARRRAARSAGRPRPQANATSAYGVDVEGLRQHVYHGLIGQATPRTSWWKRICGTSDCCRRTGPDWRRGGADRRAGPGVPAADLLESVRGRFDDIVIDCPPSLGMLTVNALAAADSVSRALQCEYYALEGLSSLLHTIELVRRGLNGSLYLEGIVLTMFDGETSSRIRSRTRLASTSERGLRNRDPPQRAI